MKEQTAKCEKQINELKKLKLQDFPGLEEYITYQTDNGLDMDQIVNKMVSLEELLKEINKNYIEIQKIKRYLAYEILRVKREEKEKIQVLTDKYDKLIKDETTNLAVRIKFPDSEFTRYLNKLYESEIKRHLENLKKTD